jgi:hypothetical protein
MAGYIEGVDRQQATLFPERLDELVAGDTLARVIDRFVDQLGVGAAGFIRAKPAGVGRVSAGRSLAAFSLRLHERGAVESGAGAGVLGEPGAGLAAHPKAAGCLGDPEHRRLLIEGRLVATGGSLGKMSSRRAGRTRWRSRAICRIWRRPMPWSTRPSRRPSRSG